MKCNNCEEEVNESHSFCPNCGKTLKDNNINKNDSKNVNDFKKQFGAGTQQHNNAENKDDSKDFRGQFGASSNSMNNDNNGDIHKKDNKRQFGSGSNKLNTSFKDNFMNIFKLDNKDEWIKRYIISILFFCLYVFLLEVQMSMVVLILDFLLFPFIICVVDHFIRKIIDKSSYIDDIDRIGCVFATIKFVIKYVFLLFVWNYSFILGIIALIYLYTLAKKLG
ncbi:zinc ribbon domain-containing protein [Staphylococcus capitis]|uniref:zinc ribbon domain-containing protein n=1 Tax=Staphylococcus capitis TaxID=29388 RepID=UPI0037D91322